MLSHRERLVLEEIAQRIAAEDPRLAATMRRWLPDRERRMCNACIVFAAIATVVCLALAAFGPGLIAAMLTAVLVVHRRRGFARLLMRERK